MDQFPSPSIITSPGINQDNSHKSVFRISFLFLVKNAQATSSNCSSFGRLFGSHNRLGFPAVANKLRDTDIIGIKAIQSPHGQGSQSVQSTHQHPIHQSAHFALVQVVRYNLPKAQVAVQGQQEAQEKVTSATGPSQEERDAHSRQQAHRQPALKLPVMAAVHAIDFCRGCRG